LVWLFEIRLNYGRVAISGLTLFGQSCRMNRKVAR
jgi:hypothetical protein